jgi:hypothetical protein
MNSLFNKLCQPLTVSLLFVRRPLSVAAHFVRWVAPKATGIKGQKSDDRGQRTDDSSQRSSLTSSKSEIRSAK